MNKYVNLLQIQGGATEIIPYFYAMSIIHAFGDSPSDESLLRLHNSLASESGEQDLNFFEWEQHMGSIGDLHLRLKWLHSYRIAGSVNKSHVCHTQT